LDDDVDDVDDVADVDDADDVDDVDGVDGMGDVVGDMDAEDKILPCSGRCT